MGAKAVAQSICGDAAFDFFNYKMPGSGDATISDGTKALLRSKGVRKLWTCIDDPWVDATEFKSEKALTIWAGKLDGHNDPVDACGCVAAAKANELVLAEIHQSPSITNTTDAEELAKKHGWEVVYSNEIYR